MPSQHRRHACPARGCIRSAACLAPAYSSDLVPLLWLIDNRIQFACQPNLQALGYHQDQIIEF